VVGVLGRRTVALRKEPSDGADNRCAFRPAEQRSPCEAARRRCNLGGIELRRGIPASCQALLSACWDQSTEMKSTISKAAVNGAIIGAVAPFLVGGLFLALAIGLKGGYLLAVASTFFRWLVLTVPACIGGASTGAAYEAAEEGKRTRLPPPAPWIPQPRSAPPLARRYVVLAAAIPFV
jgi:hypothetical protein